MSRPSEEADGDLLDDDDAEHYINMMLTMLYLRPLTLEETPKLRLQIFNYNKLGKVFLQGNGRKPKKLSLVSIVAVNCLLRETSY